MADFFIFSCKNTIFVKRTLITGGSGFLGARLALRLLEEEPDTHLLLTDQVYSSRLDAIRDRIQFVQGDISDPSFTRKLVSPKVALGRIEGTLLGDFRTVNGRGISPSAEEIATAVQEGAKKAAERKGLKEYTIGRITFKPDPSVEPIIATWPKVMHAERTFTGGLDHCPQGISGA